MSAVEAAEIGKLVDRPVSEQVRVAEAFVRFNESPEFKARFEGSKVVDTQGAPLKVYTGTATDKELDVSFAKRENLGAGLYFDKNTDVANIYAAGNGANVRPVYLDIKNPLRAESVDDAVRQLNEAGVKINKEEFLGLSAEDMKSTLRKSGHDGLDYNGLYIVQDNSQIIPAFGDKSLTDIIVQAESANTATIAKHNAQAIDPKNDAIIDYDVIDALDERRAIMEVEAKAEAEMYFQQAEAEIRQMLDEGTLNDADLAEYRKILEDMNESKKTTDALETLKLCLTGL